MNTLVLFLIFCQAFGAFVGVLTSFWGEISYILAMRDGKIDAAERTHLRIIGNGLRFGMTLLLLSSLALIIVSYTLHGALQPAMTASYWIFISFAFLIIGISWFLSRKNISFVLGSAVLLTAWWLLVYLTLGQLSISYGAAAALFIVLAAVVYAVLCLIHFLALHSKGRWF
ncbi:MAG: hypothetical protein NTU85_01975 [Candidatus Kaiserbacteria bacterium]|nr:hypothetical protein [Candidatus Kaiserbacteria bacterium]